MGVLLITLLIAGYAYYCWSRLAGELNKYEKDVETMTDNKMLNQDDIPLNQILFGPAGTVETYHSITAAVKATEPE
jgi:hypothetical protein